MSDKATARVRRGALAIALLMASASFADAAGPLGAAQRKCAATYYAALGQLVRVGGKAFAACLLLHARGQLADGTLAECIEAPNERFDAAFGRAGAALEKACDGVDREGLPKAPGFGTTEAPSALDVAIPALAGIFGSALETFGEDPDEAFADLATDAKLARCQLDVDRRQAACRIAFLATFAACARSGLRGNVAKGIAPFADADDLATCVGADPKGRIAKACGTEGAIGAAFDRACLGKGVDPALAVPACAASADGARSCIARVATCHACLTVVGAAELDPAACAACAAP